jgi:hypothetical protein
MTRTQAEKLRRPPSEPLETRFPLVILGQGVYAVAYRPSPAAPGEIAARASVGLEGARVLPDDASLPRGDHHALSGADVATRPERVFLCIALALIAWVAAGVVWCG